MRTLFDQETDAAADQGPGNDHGPDRNYSQGSDRGMGRGSYPEPAAEKPAAESHDLTLGMTALLGIFIAVALVCAVFFGFGYSAGRTLHSAKVAAPAISPAPGESSAADGPQASAEVAPQSSVSPPLTPVPSAAKPLPGAPLEQKAEVTRAPGNGEVPGNAAVLSSPTRPTSIHPTPAPAEMGAPVPVSGSGSGSVMVQIAAVVRPADAEMLAKALRANGYPAVVRTEPQDKFLHVQIGPFATRDAAKATRTQLQAAGYNAFLKP